VEQEQLDLPATFIVLTAICGGNYFYMLDRSVPYSDNGRLFPTLNEAMKNASLNQIEDSSPLMAAYLGMMIFAKCAFFFMAFREWRPGEEPVDRQTGSNRHSVSVRIKSPTLSMMIESNPLVCRVGLSGQVSAEARCWRGGHCLYEFLGK
jgi:hypothetical protein